MVVALDGGSHIVEKSGRQSRQAIVVKESVRVDLSEGSAAFSDTGEMRSALKAVGSSADLSTISTQPPRGELGGASLPTYEPDHSCNRNGNAHLKELGGC